MGPRAHARTCEGRRLNGYFREQVATEATVRRELACGSMSRRLAGGPAKRASSEIRGKAGRRTRCELACGANTGAAKNAKGAVRRPQPTEISVELTGIEPVTS